MTDQEMEYQNDKRLIHALQAQLDAEKVISGQYFDKIRDLEVNVIMNLEAEITALKGEVQKLDQDNHERLMRWTAEFRKLEDLLPKPGSVVISGEDYTEIRSLLTYCDTTISLRALKILERPRKENQNEQV